GQENTQVLKANLVVLWNRNFYSYPDITVALMCRVSVPLIDSETLSTDSVLESKKPDVAGSNSLPPTGVSGVRVSLHALNKDGMSLRETKEGERIRLDILLDDSSGE
uniref:C2 domain-containing protein n=1 Tax=Macrostomum lignano TaxID=282301 RepID=A0A1I8I5W9_9PLAT